MKIKCYSKFKFYNGYHCLQYSLKHNSSFVRKFSTVSNEFKSESKNFLENKFNSLVVWYEQFTGMDEVRMMQKRVIESQDKFVLSQEKRRDASRELADVQNKLKELYAELDTTSRGEERYLHLITQEHAILKEERKLNQEFSILEREERDSFTFLSNCVKESHEKERVQAERTKYWSIIGSVLGTIIGILGSSVNNEFKMRELRRLVKESTLKNSSDSVATLSHHEEELSAIIREMKTVIHRYNENKEALLDHELSGRLDKLLHTVSKREEENTITFVNETIQRLNQNMQEVKTLLNTAQRIDGQLVALPVDFESLIHSQQVQTRLVLAGAAILGILVPVILTRLLR